MSESQSEALRSRVSRIKGLRCRLCAELRIRLGGLLLCGLLLCCLVAFATTVVEARADDAFREQVVPFVKEYCVKCHSGKSAEAELDLTRYTSVEMLGEDFRRWEHVVTFLQKEEMPPDDAKQPPAELRAEMLATVRRLLVEEARKLAGDPGVVLPRRLSNAEYNYTIRDLTGVDIQPANSFPVDPASGEGFNNTGEALTMSPSLFKKYYAAAEHVADHVLLTTSDFQFAPYPVVTYADRKKFYEQAIIRFYEQHGVDYEDYLTAAWTFRYRAPDLRTRNIEQWADERGLSRKYLAKLCSALEGDADDPFFLGWLRRRWNALPSPENANDAAKDIRSLADDIRQLSQTLCPQETRAIVSNAGNGPIQHIARRTKTAAERDTFNQDLISDTGQLNAEVRDVLKRIGCQLPPPDPQDPTADRLRNSGQQFCALFPNRFLYVDETRGLSAGFHLIEGFFRDDQPLCKLVLDDRQNRELDRLWNELYFSTGIVEKMLRGFVFFERSERNFMKHPDFDAIKEEDPKLVEDESLLQFRQIYLERSNVKETGEQLESHPIYVFFESICNGLKQRAAQLKSAEPIYLRQLESFARIAYRRQLTDRELQRLRTFYVDTCRRPEFGVEQAVRASVVRLLVSPYFCFRAHPIPDGDSVKPLPDVALASRLSYFLWSSMPDDELLALAEAGKLQDEAALRKQTRRMLQDPKVSALALEFFGQWLGYRDFLQQESVNRAAFRDFDEELKQAMFAEPTRVITDLIQHDLPVTQLLSSDATLVNQRLARHYGMAFTGRDDQTDEWIRVTGMRELGRGGLLGMAVFLTKNSQPERTSPVKRGFWVYHKVLGEHIPPPPPNVAVLPAKETDTNGQTIRQLLNLHTSDAKCARCHQRFDPLGLAMEGFDPIGRSRSKDLAGRPIDNVVHLPTGEEAHGVPDFAAYLATHRRDDFVKTLCRKFLGYALGRSLLLSDQPLLDKMEAALRENDYRFGPLFETVVLSPQFRHQRCRDFTTAGFRKESHGD